MPYHRNQPARTAFAASALAAIIGMGITSLPRRTPAQQQPAFSGPVPSAAESRATANAAQAEVPSQTPGYLGVVTDDRGEGGQGVRVVQVVADSPAAQGGLQVGDLIVTVDQQPIRSMGDLAAIVRATRPEDTKTFEVHRDEQKIALDVQLGHRPARAERPYAQFGRIEPQQPASQTAQSTRQPAQPPPKVAQRSAAPRQGILGVRTAPVTAEAQRFLGLPTFRGALVVEVFAGSPAQQAGIPLNALIVSVDAQSVANPRDLGQLIMHAGDGHTVELSFYTGNRLHRMPVTLGPFSAEAVVARTPSDEPFVGDSTESGTKSLDARITELELSVRELGQLVRQLLDAQPQADNANESPRR